MLVYYVIRTHHRPLRRERIGEFCETKGDAVTHIFPGEEIRAGDRVVPHDELGSMRYIDKQGYVQYQRSEDSVRRRRRKHKRNCGPCRMNPRRSRRSTSVRARLARLKRRYEALRRWFIKNTTWHGWPTKRHMLKGLKSSYLRKVKRIKRK